MNRTLVVTGIVLMLFGAGVLVAGTALATVLWPQTFWYNMEPIGSETAPQQLTPGSSITLAVSIVYSDPSLKISLPDPKYWTVYCFIIRPGIESWSINLGAPASRTTITLPPATSTSMTGGTVYIATWKGSWTVPTTADATYQFKWYAKVIDSSGKVVSEASTITYGTTKVTTGDGTAGDGVDVTPNGYFTVNNVRVEPSSTIVTLDGGLTVRFVATVSPSAITKVYFTSKYGIGTPITKTVNLEKLSSTEWSTAYRLTDYGSHEINGYFEWTKGTAPILKMSSLVVTYKEQVAGDGAGEEEGEVEVEEDGTIAGLSKLEVVGLSSASIGLILTVVGIAVPEPKRRS